MPETIHCRVKGCGKAIRVKDFPDRMAKLRRHRKKYHPSAFKESIKKGVKTRMAKRNPRTRRMTRKQKIMGLSTGTLALLAAGGVAAWYFLFRNKGTTV